MNEALKKALEIRGGQAKLARLCKVTRATVSNWIYKGIPPERVRQIERHTGVSRISLRPDIYAPKQTPLRRNAVIIRVREEKSAD